MTRTAFSCALFVALAVSTLAVGPASQDPKLVPRHVTGGLDGTFVFPPTATYPYFITEGDATGTLSHLGLATLLNSHIPNDDGTLADGTFTIVAANGDEIWGTYDDGAVTLEDAVFGPDPPDFLPWYFEYTGTATLVISGGTGRFVGASGTFNGTFSERLWFFTSDYSQYDCTVTWTLEGTVNY